MQKAEIVNGFFRVMGLMLATLVCLSHFIVPQTPDVSVESRPRSIWKIPEAGHLDSEAWMLNIVVKDKQKRVLEPTSAQLKIFSGAQVLTTETFSADSLKNIAFKIKQNEAVLFIAHRCTAPTSFKADRVEYSLTLADEQGKKVEASVAVPVGVYENKTQLHYPLKVPAIILNGTAVDGGHAAWQQLFAVDFFLVDPVRYGPMTATGEVASNYFGWGQQVFAPADGVVYYSRNDVPDQQDPSKNDESTYNTLPDPLWAEGGNVVAIDHGNGEYSVLCHMRQGSVVVKKGDRVKTGDLLGLVGNAGNTFGPHLHYQLQAGPEFNRSDPLPLKFVDIQTPLHRGKYISPPSP